MPHVVEAWSLNHWTAREVPRLPRIDFGVLSTVLSEIAQDMGFPSFL